MLALRAEKKTQTHTEAISRPFRSSLVPLFQNEVKCPAFDMEMIFHSHANKTRFHKKGCAIGLNLKVRVFGTRKWPIYCVKFLNSLFDLFQPPVW